ncbi:MAG: hypothetical protein QNI91_18080 [Arenicellales bacterium]|nr:hypothetical protein [Arenicellales bacterium]
MNAFKTLFDITLIQAKPQDVPFSYPLLAITAVTSIISYILALEPVGPEVTRVLGKQISVTPLAVAEHLFFAATVWVILRFRRHTERFVQTITSMFGVSTIIQLIMWPVTGWLLKNQGTPEANIPAFLIFGLRVWILIVYAHIFKETLETRFIVGALFTIASWMLTSMLLLLVIDLFTE